MKRDKKLSTVAVLGLTLVMVCGVGLSGTYAKYTSTKSATDSARVAKWSFKVGGADITKSTTMSFNLFETINDTLDSDEEADVDKATGEGVPKIIAPGTEGEFDIKLVNESEVSAEYSLGFTMTNTGNIPVEFSTDGGDTWETDLASLNVVADADHSTKLSSKADTEKNHETITVMWRWAFEGADSENFTESQTDTTDTDLGTAETPATLTLKVDVTATQVD